MTPSPSTPLPASVAWSRGRGGREYLAAVSSASACSAGASSHFFVVYYVVLFLVPFGTGGMAIVPKLELYRQPGIRGVAQL